MRRIMSYKKFIVEAATSYREDAPAWSDSWTKHIINNIPLTRDIVKILFEGKRSFGFHISDIDHTENIMSLEGTKKSISCFTYFKRIENTSINNYTKGGVLYLLEGDLLFSLNRDAMSRPDESGRRWIDVTNFPREFQAELREWRKNKDEEFYQRSDNSTYLRKYLTFIEGLVKKHAEEIRRFCNLYYDDIEERLEDDYNELVLNNIKIKEVLLDKDVILGYDSDERSLYDDGQDFGDTRLKEIIEVWNKKSIKVVIADNKDEVVKWFHEKGGISDHAEFIKGKNKY